MHVCLNIFPEKKTMLLLAFLKKYFIKMHTKQKQNGIVQSN